MKHKKLKIKTVNKMDLIKQKVDNIVKECNYSPVELEKFANEYWNQFDKETQLEIYKRLITLKGQF